MPGLAGVIQSVAATTAAVTVPGSDGTMSAVVPSNLAGIAVAGVQAIIDWQPPSDQTGQGNWIITQAGGVPGVIPRGGLDPAVQSDIATGVQASSKADTAQQAADAAKKDAAAAAAQAGVAIASANGRNTSTHSTTDPTTAGVSGKTDNDMWYRHVVLTGKPASDLSGPVDGQWTWQQGQWIGMGLTAGVFASVDGGTATFGAVSGLNLYSPGMYSTPRTQIDGSSIQVVRSDGEDGEVVTTSLGGEDEDHIQIFGTDGQLRGGIDSDGVVIGSSVQTPQVLLDGDDVRGLIDAMSWGYAAGHIFTADAGPIGQTETPIVDLQFMAYPGRRYEIIFNASCSIPPTGRLVCYYRTSIGTIGATTVARPTTSSPDLGNSIFPAANYYSTNYAAPVFYSVPWSPPDTITKPTACRVLLSGLFQGTGSSLVYRHTGSFVIKDMGSRYAGAFNDGNFGSGAVTTMTQYFQPGWTTVWRNGSSQPGVQTPQQGNATRALGVGHPAGGWYTMVRFPDAMRTFMAGAQKISDVSLWTNCYDCMNTSGFVPRLSWHAQSTSPTGPVGSGDFDLSNLPKGAARWNQLPVGSWSSIQSGTYQGLTFGLRVGQDAKYAGCFSITDGAPGAFRVTVTK